MKPAAGAANPKPFTGRRMAIYIVTGFGIVVAVNLTLATLAVGSWSGLLARNGYVASQNFNSQLAKARNQAARGWKDRLIVIPGGLRFEVTDAAGEAVTGLKLRLHLGRPVHENDDFEVMLTAVQGGYAATTNLAPGAWRAQVFSVDSHTAYKRKFRLRITAPEG